MAGFVSPDRQAAAGADDASLFGFARLVSITPQQSQDQLSCGAGPAGRKRRTLAHGRFAPQAAGRWYKRCARARSLSKSLISRNSRSARSASASSKGQSCRHCSDRRKSQAGRNSASRHRTRNNLGLDRYTKDAGCGAPCAKPKLSGRNLEGCYSAADDSPAGSRSRASVAPGVYEPARPARRPAAATGRWQSTETLGAT
jgi:hypothetical protein